MFDQGYGDAPLGNPGDEFARPVQGVDHPNSFSPQALFVIDALLGKPAFSVSDEYFPKHVIRNPIRLGYRILAGLVTRLNISRNELRYGGHCGAQGLLDTEQSFSMRDILHKAQLSRAHEG